jgi:cyanate lyase
MRHHPVVTTEPRLRATPALRTQIRAQGRRFDWVAARLGRSKSYVSKVVSGRLAVPESDARVLAALLDGELGMLFDLPNDMKYLPNGSSAERRA